MPPLVPTPAVWPITRIQPGDNCRQIEIDDSIRELHQSILTNGLLQPLLVIDRAEAYLIAGFRRAAAMSLGGIGSCQVQVYPASITLGQILLLQFCENSDRQDLSPPETYHACKAILAENGWARKDLAAHLKKDQSTVTRWLCPDNLIPEALNAFLAGKFGFAKAYALAKRTPEEQRRKFASLLNGATRDELEADVRQRSDTQQEIARVPVLKLEVGLVTLSFKAEKGVSLEDAMAAALAAKADFEAAKKDHHDASTFKTWVEQREKAKKPGVAKAGA